MELISRDEAIKIIVEKYGHDNYDFEGMLNECKVYESRPKGEWIGIGYDGYADGSPVYDEWECSNCGHEIKTEDTPPYCEMCGADMGGEE